MQHLMLTNSEITNNSQVQFKKKQRNYFLKFFQSFDQNYWRDLKRWFVLLCVFNKFRLMFDDWVIQLTFVFHLGIFNLEKWSLSPRERKERGKKSDLKVNPGDKFSLILTCCCCCQWPPKKITQFHWKNALHYLVQVDHKYLETLFLLGNFLERCCFYCLFFIETGKIISIFK